MTVMLVWNVIHLGNGIMPRVDKNKGVQNHHHNLFQRSMISSPCAGIIPFDQTPSDMHPPCSGI